MRAPVQDSGVREVIARFTLRYYQVLCNIKSSGNPGDCKKPFIMRPGHYRKTLVRNPTANRTHRPAIIYTPGKSITLIHSAARGLRQATGVSPASKGGSMPAANVDPEEVRRFAHNLKQFNNDLQSRLSVLHGQLVALSNTWRDREHEKFSREFSQTLIAVKRFTDLSSEHIPFLLRKAERADEYLNQG
jgi:uncharacterized protein YukE